MSELMHSDSEILDPIPVHYSVKQLIHRLRLREHPELLDEFHTVLAHIEKIIRPRAVFRTYTLNRVEPGIVAIEAERFRSRILASSLLTGNRVHVFAATAGMEGESWAGTLTDQLTRYWAFEIMGEILEHAINHLRQHIRKSYGDGPLSCVEPGTSVDWDLPSQEPLFRLLGDLPARIDLELLPENIMRPIKSLSGIMFPTQRQFHHCNFCDNDSCLDRKNPHRPELFADLI